MSAMSQMRRRVVLVDDHAAFRASAVGWLTHEGFEVVGDAASAAEGVRMCEDTWPDLVLMDINLPDASGIDAARKISASSRPPVVILISSDTEAASDPRVLDAAAAGFLAKRDLACEAIDALLS